MIKLRYSLLVAALGMAGALTASAKDYEIKHLEPLNWWVGMKHPELQLMVHADNIADLEPAVSHEGVELVSSERTENKNYLFLNLRIDEKAKPGKFTIAFKKGVKAVAKVDYRLETRRANSANRTSFTSADAIYLITPDRFANGNPGNDAMPDVLEKPNRTNKSGRHGGDLKGMRDHLDYIASLGFTMVWPTPLIQNNQAEYSYHGYSPTDHYQIDSRFGSNEDFKNYVAAANKNGLGVIQDIVLNHIGSGHWWMTDLPASDWLNFQTGFVPTNHQHTTVLDIHAAKYDKTGFADGWFVDTMPDMNQRNPFLAKYLIQNTVWWIEYANLSGVREDTWAYTDKGFLSAWSKYVLEEYPNFNIVGEEMNSNPQILAYWQKGVQNRDGYQSFLPSLMDFPVVFLLPTVMNAPEARDSGFMKLYEMIANDFVYADPMRLVVFPDNHDTPRLFSLLRDDVSALKTALIFYATTRGIPQFYYGTEILAKSPVERDDGLVRSDMPGGWAGDKVNAFTGKGLSAEQADMQQLVRTLLNWRKTSDAVTQGKLLHFVPEAGVYVYFRYTDKQKVMVVLNKNAQDTKLELARFSEILGAASKGRNIVSGVSVNLTAPLALRAKESLVLEIQ
jgi:neopullulanase